MSHNSTFDQLLEKVHEYDLGTLANIAGAGEKKN